MTDTIATVQQIYAAFGAGDVPGILAHLTDDITWEHDWVRPVPPLYVPKHGHAGVVEFLTALQATEFLQFQPLNFLSGGDQVAVPIRLHLRVKATGREVIDHEMHLWTFGAAGQGKATAFRHLCDTLQFAEAFAA